jgi:CubicO group peptidase (beta-lactamase class C family)
MKKRFPKNLATSFVLLSLILLSLPLTGKAQVGNATLPSGSYESALTAIEAKTDARRQELGIPGVALAIVKDDQIIYMKGLGYKDFEKKIPVTPDTQFAIGSSTKAFTGLSVLMSEDEGKLSLDASPRTVLPYFKMADPDTDTKMTIRDLLTHTSGLGRTDVAMVSGKLTRAELIRVAGEAKPVAKFREAFGYQNLMFAAAGEVVAVAQKQPWEKFVEDRIFKPLGMTNSNLSITQMAKAGDRSIGYRFIGESKTVETIPYRNIDVIGPAGSINSSANDMAKWLRFVLNGGAVDGKRIVSEKAFAEWVKPQNKMGNYGLGWFIQKWNGLTVVQHGGNIDGFNAMVAMVPEKKLGFVMLTNVTASTLGDELMTIVWQNILGEAKKDAGTAGTSLPEKEAGTYRLEAAGVDVEISWKEGKLVASVPGQPAYTLENVGGRKYKMVGAPDGFFMTFKDSEMYLEQPQGSFTLPKSGAAAKPPASEAAKALIGKYQSESSGHVVEIKELDGSVVLAIEGQQPYALVEREKDKFSMSPLPDEFFLTLKRAADGKFEKFTVTQPQGEFGYKPAVEVKFDFTVDELLSRSLEALGGEANWRKLSTRVATATLDMVNQGVKGTAKSWAKAPGKAANETRLIAVGKEIGSIWDYFDGTAGEEAASFAPATKYAGKRLEDVRLTSDFHGMLDLRSKYKTIELKRIAKCGEEDCYAVEFVPEKGNKFTEFYSAKSYLLLRREGVFSLQGLNTDMPYNVRYEDYREVDGIKLPFKVINSNPANGTVVSTLTSVKHNVPVDDKIFATRKIK